MQKNFNSYLPFAFSSYFLLVLEHKFWREERLHNPQGALQAVILAVSTYHHYLCSRQLLIRTDHRALKWLLKFKDPEGQLARWQQLLGTYDFRIEHRSGLYHANADALSRRPSGHCRHGDRAEQKEDPASVAASESSEAVQFSAYRYMERNRQAPHRRNRWALRCQYDIGADPN